MKNYFDYEKMMAILKDYYIVTHIRIAFLNNEYQDIAGYPSKKADLCEYIRTSKMADKKCQECDKNACSIARDTGSVYMYQCHAGLYEIIQPLQINGLTIGYLFFAHMLAGPSYEFCFKDISSKVKNYNLDMEKIKQLIYKSSLLNQEYIKSASRLLETIATHLCMEKMGLFKQHDNMLNKINNYINEHISEEITIRDICLEIGIGKTKLCTLSNKYFKNGIHNHIRSLRIAKAKEIMINNPEATINDICQATGFNDYNYFIYIFRKEVGMTPKKFINKYRSSSSILTSL